ncbi:MAG: hypothetical protein IT324_10075 [Anaerolineae bacterium]|nr:hypothetical protein [Anaerolineae bacterium]
MPNITLDPNLSVYGLVHRTKAQRTFLNHRRAMLIVSYEIENAIILDKARARVFAGFQRMSRFLPQVKRYQKLAQHAESVYVFGIMDVQPPPIAGVRYIPLKENFQLAKEWFLIADAPDYFSALATEEISTEGIPDDQRVFEGVWSFDEDMITILQEWLTSLVDARPLGDLSANRNYRRQISLMTDAMGRMTARLARAIDRPTPKVAETNQEVRTMMQENLAPSVEATQDKLNQQPEPPR